MIDVDTSRVTARIPVIQFIDPVSSLDCDICVNNQLALRNTRLLKSYGLFDERVRLVAYIIKTWSKRRDLNSPERSTLSSYGYLLTLLAHLQRRVPVLVRFISFCPLSSRCSFACCFIFHFVLFACLLVTDLSFSFSFSFSLSFSFVVVVVAGSHAR